MRHTFTLSGLGLAPFKILHPNSAEAKSNVSFSCEHCGRMIKNRFFVQSADQVVSVVGIDCIEKSGDNGLIAGEKRLRNVIRNESRESLRQEKQRVQDESDRALLNGLTRSELSEQIVLSMESLLADYAQTVFEHGFSRKFNESGFQQNMVARLASGYMLSENMVSTSEQVLAKKLANGARAGSAKMLAELGNAKSLINDIQTIVSNHITKMDDLSTELNLLGVGSLDDYLSYKSKTFVNAA